MRLPEVLEIGEEKLVVTTIRTEDDGFKHYFEGNQNSFPPEFVMAYFRIAVRDHISYLEKTKVPNGIKTTTYPGYGIRNEFTFN